MIDRVEYYLADRGKNRSICDNWFHFHLFYRRKDM